MKTKVVQHVEKVVKVVKVAKVVKVEKVARVKVFQVFQNIPGSQLLSDIQTFFYHGSHQTRPLVGLNV